MVATYRDDELERTHPLGVLLGELRGHDLRPGMTTEPLSPVGVLGAPSLAFPLATLAAFRRPSR